MRNYYVPGEWNAICEICGFQHKASELRKNWKGQRVCPKDFETRHPQDLIRPRADNPSVPWTRPEADDVFIGAGDPIMTETGEFMITDESGSPLLTED